MKIEEVKSKTEHELGFELDQMKKELFELRFKSRTAGSPPARIRVLKRSIARILTVQRERVLKEGASSARSAPAKSR